MFWTSITHCVELLVPHFLRTPLRLVASCDVFGVMIMRMLQFCFCVPVSCFSCEGRVGNEKRLCRTLNVGS